LIESERKRFLAANRDPILTEERSDDWSFVADAAFRICGRGEPNMATLDSLHALIEMATGSRERQATKATNGGGYPETDRTQTTLKTLKKMVGARGFEPPTPSLPGQ
jgi:hypothetical protein